MIIFIFYIFNTMLLLKGLMYLKEHRRIRVNDEKENNNFAILIPAHNEEDVICNTVDNIMKMRYKNFKVYVLCDNCTDNTATRLRKHIGIHAISRIKCIDVNGGDKNKCIKAGISKIKELGLWDGIDKILILDADNIPSRNMLIEYNRQFNNGRDILQCKILSKNDDNMVSSSFKFSFRFIDLLQSGRNKLGLSAYLSGTGFSMDKELFLKYTYNLSSLVEDFEMSIHLILDGFRISFVESQYVLNENVEDVKSMYVQLTRWSRGNVQVMLSLFISALVKGRVGIMQRIDVLNIVSMPGKGILLLITNIMWIIDIGGVGLVPWYIILALIMINLIITLLVTGLNISNFMSKILFSLSVIFITPYALLTHSNKTWAKTVHKIRYVKD